MSTEYHVASFVVHVLPENADSVESMIQTLPGAEVHVSEGGKLVVTIECESRRLLADRAEALGIIDQVLQVAPVYHEYTEIESTGNQNP